MAIDLALLRPGIRRRRRQRRNLLKGILFIMPWLIGFVAFRVYPMASAVYYSLTIYDVLRPPQFIGLGNFYELAGDPYFHNAVKVTLNYTILTVPGGALLAFVLALLLNTSIRLRSFWRTVFFIPTVVPAFVAAIVWRWIYHQQYGLFNVALMSLGLKTIPWLGSPDWAGLALVIIGWWQCGTAVVIFLAALQDVPRELIEAAMLDGASRLRQVLHVTVPLVTPQILYVVLYGMIGALQTFVLSMLLTQGGPIRATQFIMLYLYEKAFLQMRMGYATAVAWALFVMTFTLSIIVFRTSRTWVYYGGEAQQQDASAGRGKGVRG